MSYSTVAIWLHYINNIIIITINYIIMYWSCTNSMHPWNISFTWRINVMRLINNLIPIVLLYHSHTIIIDCMYASICIIIAIQSMQLSLMQALAAYWWRVCMSNIKWCYCTVIKIKLSRIETFTESDEVIQTMSCIPS